jgi:DeoR/GlpR family transcriptional regulator of sugar metabolism
VKTQSRREAILECLEQRSSLSYRELADRFQISSMTIRRDVDALCHRGLVMKAAGGVRRVERLPPLFETPLASRLSIQRAEKRAIALAAVDLIAPGQTVYLDGGTSSVELAQRIANRCVNVTVLSNSTLICMELGRSPKNAIIGIGGNYVPDNLCFVGPTAEDFARRYFVDIAFFSTKGLLPNEGTYESFEPTFRIKQILAGQCSRVVVLADHTKFGQRSLCKVLDISQIHTVVTDELTPVADRALLEQGGREVLAAPLSPSGNALKREGADHAA